MNRKKVFEIFLLTLVFLYFFPTQKALASVLEMGVEELTLNSSRIIIGTVTELSSNWETENGRNSIFTYVTLKVETYVKGSGPQVITAKVPGGTVGDITEWVSDTPKFASGEKVLLFLWGEFNRIVGGYQGKFIIQDEKVLGPDVTIYNFVYQIRKTLQQASPESFQRQKGEIDLTFPIPTSIILDEKSWRELREKAIQTRELPYQEEVYHEGMQASWDTTMTEGFEGAFPSGLWSVTGNPTWGADDYKPHSGSMSAWCARGGSSGLDPAANNYPNNMDGRMIYGPFELSSAIDAELLFYLWLESESYYDGFVYYASKDGIHWHGYGLSGYSGDWLSRNFDLTSVPTLGNLCGESEVWIMLRFYSDSSVTYKGAFVDDIVLQKSLPTEPPPLISDISPSKASAGTGTTVAIYGVNFGETQGSSKVEFFYRSGQPKISAPIISWSNTAIVCEVPAATVNQYPASAGSGPVMVTTSEGGKSNDYTFRVSFGYGGRHWPGSNAEVEYYVNENASDCTGEGSAVIAAAEEYNTAGSRFTFRYVGAASSTGDSKNGMNEIVWAPISTPGVIGYAHYWIDFTDNTHLEECDIVFNDNLDWGHGASASYFDVQTIAAHELGHWLNLRDLYGDVDDDNDNDSAKTMYGFESQGVVKQSLHSDDISGILWIYGEEPTITPKAMPWIHLLLGD